jgi:hypothetical protein
VLTNIAGLLADLSLDLCGKHSEDARDITEMALRQLPDCTGHELGAVERAKWSQSKGSEQLMQVQSLYS